jgi:hypothetical protein
MHQNNFLYILILTHQNNLKISKIYINLKRKKKEEEGGGGGGWLVVSKKRRRRRRRRRRRSWVCIFIHKCGLLFSKIKSSLPYSGLEMIYWVLSCPFPCSAPMFKPILALVPVS